MKLNSFIAAVAAAGLLVVCGPSLAAAVRDLNGDGKSDLLWYNAATGQTSTWLMNGTSLIGSAVLLTDPNWKVVGTPDLNGDGKSDLLWYNAATGQTSTWLMNGTSLIGSAVLLTDPNWKVVGTPDLNGDGKSDLLWYNAATGQTSTWLMNGTSLIGSAVLLTDPNWKVVGTPDLNGDGKSDLLWYNAATGQTSTWLMNGTSLIGSAVLLTDPNWKVVGTPDLNSDGKSDLLWYNAATGQTSTWLMNGTSTIDSAVLLTDPNWKVVGTPDLNGDGKSDLLWYNAATGQTSTWLMNGTSTIGSAVLLTDPNWKVTGTPSAPVAAAGASQNVLVGALVSLDGSASKDAYGYAWTLTSKPAGSSATLSGSTSAKPTFVADIAGNYVVTLVVNDGKVNSAAVTVTITASVADSPPALVCNPGNGNGTNGVSLYTPNNSFNYQLSTTIANAPDILTLGWGAAYSGPYGSYTGSLRAALWAVSSSYSGGSIYGYVLGPIAPNFTGPGARSSDQIWGGNYSTTTIVSSVADYNPPKGQYCMVMVLSQYMPGQCSSTDGYCLVDWIQFRTPQTFY